MLGTPADCELPPALRHDSLTLPTSRSACSATSVRQPQGGEWKLARAVKPNSLPKFDPRGIVTQIRAGKTSREYKKKEIVFSQGDPADAVFYLESGQINLTVVSTGGKEALIAILEPGMFFGEGCLTGQPIRMSTAGAVARSMVVRIAKKTMVAWLRREPDFADLFIAYLLARNVRIEEDLVDQLFNSSEKRLARVLLQLAHFGQDSKTLLIPRISQETLASMIGTTRSRASHFMNRFRKMGFIEYDGGGLTIHPALLSVVLRDSS